MLTHLKNLIHSAKNHQGFRRHFSNISWMFGEQMLRMSSGLLVGIWVARYLGPEQFGLFSYALAFVAIFSGIAKLGLDGILVRELVNHQHHRDLYLGTAFWLKFAGAFFMVFIVAIALLFTKNDHTTNLYILIIASGVIFQSFEVVDFYFQSQVLSKFISICKITQIAVSSALKIYFVFTGSDLIWFVLVTLLDQATLAFTMFIAYRHQKLGSFYFCFDFYVAKKLIKNSWPLMVCTLLLMIQARSDQVMLKAMIGSLEVGYYSSGMRIIETFGFIPMVITTSLFPAIVNAKKISENLYKSRLFLLYRLMIILFLPLALVIFLFGTQIIVLLYGDAFVAAGPIFSLMAFRLFFANYGVVRGAYLMTENLVSFSMISMAIGTIVNVILNYLLIPRYHSMGAILASTVSLFISTFVIDLCYCKTRENCIMMFKSMLGVNLHPTKN